MAIFDAFSRYPVHWMVTTNLRGRTHSDLLSSAVREAGVAPMVLSIDGARAWNGVFAQTAVVHDMNEVVIVELPDGKPPARFHHVTSVASPLNTPVERQWREVK